MHRPRNRRTDAWLRTQYAELDPPIVNPIAMFLSAVMMLEHVGDVEKAHRIREAIAAVVKEGKVRTYDMMRPSGGAKAITQGTASTVQMTDAVLAKLSALSADPSKDKTELAGVGHK